MEELGVIIAILALIGTPLASWVIINRKIATLTAEKKSLEKQLTAIEINVEKEVKRLEADYKERFDKVEKAQRDHERSMDRTFDTLFKKLDDDKEQILSRLVEVTKEIGELKGKLSR